MRNPMAGAPAGEWPKEIEGLRIKLETALRMLLPEACPMKAEEKGKAWEARLDDTVAAILDKTLVEQEPADLIAMAKRDPAWIQQAAKNLLRCHLAGDAPPVTTRGLHLA